LHREDFFWPLLADPDGIESIEEIADRALTARGVDGLATL
jgi:hypothetical protein